jgi:uncharacterized protein YkwD
MAEGDLVMRSLRTNAPLMGLLFVSACQLEATEDFGDSSAVVFASSGCPAPAGVSADTVLAMEEVNRVRRAGGLGCVAHSPEIAFAAERHCQYYVNNTGRCTAKPHREVSECKSYMAETFSDRLQMASYAGSPRFEVMAYVGHGQVSVGQWLDSVWHRIPILSPDVDQAGYGQSGRCDTMDFGNSTETSVMKNLVYPFDGQQGVPVSFSGRESPEPPAPPHGWPSGYPITLYAVGMTVDHHSITVDGSDKPLAHTFLAPGDARAFGLLVDEFFLYTDKPLASKTRYRVRLTGTQNGAPAAFEWTFTTR